MMLVLVPSATHIWERVIPDGWVHCHWKEPSLATVQERLAADTTLSTTIGSICRNVMSAVGSSTNEREKTPYHNMFPIGYQYIAPNSVLHCLQYG